MTWMLAGPSSGQRNEQRQDFPGSPVAKSLPSNAGCAGSIPGWGEKIPYVQKTSKPRSSMVTNSTNTLNMVHIKKKKKEQRCCRAVPEAYTVASLREGACTTLMSCNSFQPP